MASNIMYEYCQTGDIGKDYDRLSNYIECMCYDGDDPFVWESTTTTTPRPGPEPFPPKLYTTTTAPSFLDCNVPTTCMDAMHQYCGVHDGGTECQQCLGLWWPHEAPIYGCPSQKPNQIQSLMTCFCGTATPKNETLVPVEIQGIHNHYKQSVTLSTLKEGQQI